ncbi:Rho GTPase-activating protein, partial [Dispira parvispora]
GIVENSSLRKPRSKSMSNTVAMILGRDSSSGDVTKAEKDARNKAEHSNDVYKTQLSITSSIRHDYFTVLLPSMLAALRSIAEESDLALSLYLAKYTRAYEQSIFADATLVKPVDQRSTAKGLLPMVQTIDSESDLAQFMAQYGRRSQDKAERTSNLSGTPAEPPGSTWVNLSSTNDSNASIGTSGQRTTTDAAGSTGGGLLSPGMQAQLQNNYLTSPRTTSGYNAAGAALASSAAGKGGNIPRLTLEYQVDQSNTPVPAMVTTCTNFIEKYGLTSEGLYRLSGQNSVVKQFKEEFDLTGHVEKFEQLDNTFDVNNVTSFLKLYFRELPDGLIPMQAYDQFVKIVDASDPQERIKQAEAALAALPKPNYDTLHHMILHLHRIQEHRQTNMMNISNLAIVFGPTLVRSPDHVNPITSMQTQCKIVEHILEGCHELFGSKS